MHSNNPMIPFTPDDLRLNATIRHELIIETLVTLARGNRGNTATPRNLPRGIGIQIGKVRIHVMHAMVMRNLGLGAIRQNCRYTSPPPITHATGSSATAAKASSTLCTTSTPSGAKPSSRVSTMLRRFLSGRPPGKLNSVLRPIMTGQPLVRATNDACRHGWTPPCRPRTQYPSHRTRRR